ncbi:MAG: pseudouridine synthase [Pseudomonadales bacterium]|nr:pseudouridine synthase [Pseudomonadales bacterium]NRA18056.1 pseudouridine synthase [Oceanospirillaceae bacterium]
MSSKFSRLDRFISQKTLIKRKDVRLMLAQKRIQVDGKIALDTQQLIGPFNQVVLDHKLLQQCCAQYWMMNKPVGVVSATKDKIHKTVIELLNPDCATDLHIVGRLDLNSSGLILLTNDGSWSSALTKPANKVPKRYRVDLAEELSADYITAFANGMYFGYENITTLPATLTIIGDRRAEVELFEGKYHQIKRMFGRFRNPVLALHRTSIGELQLCPALQPGQYRALSASEVASLTFTDQ